jgi:hypothetical protein
VLLDQYYENRQSAVRGDFVPLLGSNPSKEATDALSSAGHDAGPKVVATDTRYAA